MLEKIKHKKAICLILGFVILLLLTSYLVSPDEGEVYDIISTRRKIEDLRLERKDSIDVIFAGDSLVFRDISPLRIWEKSGITSYDLSDGAMRLCDQCVLIRNFCRRQSPKLLVLEADIMTKEASPYKDDFAIPTNLIERIFPIFHYHTFYKGLGLFGEYKGAAATKGYQPEETVEPYEGRTDYMEAEAEPVEIGERNLIYLKRIVDFCEKNDIELLILALPSPGNYNKEVNKAVQRWADDNGVSFTDLNYECDDIGIDWLTDTKDGGDHLNRKGAEKVSDYLAGFFSENYTLTDHRDDPEYSDWKILRALPSEW
ncbi:MAG: SGNH/GDSL hydrolase family protein [Lachnospiraceae bacterium]|nr:SGNH/GDSL hydrolase family protein [Lachnospiraceae bacterium]